MRFLSLIPLLFLFIACGSNTPKNIEKNIDQLIDQDEYEKAISILEDADSSKTTADLKLLREKVHLNYGMHLEYRGEGEMGMRERMTGALRQFIETLKINPNNQKARSEINQIMSIYATMPKSPGKDIKKELQKLGFSFEHETSSVKRQK